MTATSMRAMRAPPGALCRPGQERCPARHSEVRVAPASGSVVMGLAVNSVAAELLALTIGFYIFIYTYG